MKLNLNIKPLHKKKIHPCYGQFEKIDAASPHKNRIVPNGYFAGADLRCSHDGLTELASKRKINLNTLRPGELVVFVNNAQDRVKVFTAGYNFSYLKMPNHQRINPGVISLIPKFFNGSKIDYTGALREVITEQFGGKK